MGTSGIRPFASLETLTMINLNLTIFLFGAATAARLPARVPTCEESAASSSAANIFRRLELRAGYS